MCGIAGLLASAPQPEGSLDGALASLAHRGPDASHVWSADDGTVALGCRRLAIIDLSRAADQPMRVGHVVVVNNGEIYNHVELRAELEGLGRRFATRSDTEVLGAAFLQWGPAMLDRLNGMFALAIWDDRARRLFLARDRLGEKPLYYTRAPGRLAFASEIKALVIQPWVTRAANEPVLMRYLETGDVPDGSTETFFKDIQQLPAGHRLSVDGTTPGRVEPYWRVSPGEPTPVRADAQEEFVHLFGDSVRLRLRSDVTLGLSLSGGIDSSLVAERVRALLPVPAELSAFSATHPGTAADESRHIDLVADRLALRSCSVAVDPLDLLRDAHSFAWHQDEPVATSSAYAHWKVSELAAGQGVKVMLEGQGADELFGGYHAPAFGHRWSSALRRGDVVGVAGGMIRYARAQRVSPIVPLGFLGAAAAPDGLARRLRRRRLSRGVPLRREWSGLARDGSPRGGDGSLLAELIDELDTTSLPSILRYVDRNSMAHSIEVRLPFLDHRLVEFALALPPDAVIAGGWNKLPLRRALRAALPEIASRPDKVGFSTPEATWLRGPLRAWATDLLSSAGRRPYYETGGVERLWRRFLDGGSTSASIWRVCNAELWSQLFLDRPPVAP
jgi:asparagine synthase (glutamine-hydrolysing)